MFLRLSSRDGRCPYGKPIGLVDPFSGEFVAAFRNSARGTQAYALIERVSSYAQDLSAADIHSLAADTSQNLYGEPEYEALGMSKFNSLIATLRMELGAGRNR